MITLNINDKNEIYWDLEDLFFQKLKTKELNYNKIIGLYIDYLNQEHQNHIQQLSEADLCLIMNYDKHENITDENVKDLTTRYLVKYNRFENAPISKELKQRVIDNKLNLNGNYLNDLYEKGND